MSRPRIDLTLPDGVGKALMSSLIAVLYALGLTLPLLAISSQTAYIPRAVAACLGTAIVTEILKIPAGRFRKFKALLLILLAGVALTMYLDTITNVIHAMYLKLGGKGVALKVYTIPVITLLSILATLISRYMTQESAGVVESFFLICVLLFSARVVNLLDNAAYIVPAVIALLCILSRTGYMLTPSRRALPIALLLAIVALVFVPSGRTTVKPMEDAARAVRQYIEDRFFFTEARENFSLTKEGYQPYGIQQLGGRPTIEEHEVLSVDTTHDLYLRGTVMDMYNGRAWYDTLGNRRYVYSSLRNLGVRETLFDQNTLTGKLETVTVRVLRDGTSTVFLPQRLRSLSMPAGVVPYFSASTEVFLPRNITQGDSYTFTWLPLVAGSDNMAALIASHAQSADARYEQVAAQYLGVPDHIQRDVYDIADDATRGAQTPYEKALALQSYLKEHYPYSLDVNEPPSDMDFVVNFLLSERKGYCTYFASAMTILCRIVGLPARYVTGFHVDADPSGTTIVRGKNGHAWTEVYFRGVGWVTVDATASSDDSNNNDNTQGDTPSGNTPPPATPTPSPTPSQAPSEAPGSTPTPEPEKDTQTPTPEPQQSPPSQTPTPEPQSADSAKENRSRFPWVILLVVCLVALAAWRVIVTSPERRAGKLPVGDAFITLYAACEQALSARGLARRRTETPIAFARRAQENQGVQVEELARRLCGCIYGKRTPDAKDVACALTAYRMLHRTLNRRQKAMLALRRAATFKTPEL